jgi:hypothetical protein
MMIFFVRRKGANFVIRRCNKCQQNHNRAKTLDVRFSDQQRTTGNR